MVSQRSQVALISGIFWMCTRYSNLPKREKRMWKSSTSQNTPTVWKWHVCHGSCLAKPQSGYTQNIGVSVLDFDANLQSQWRNMQYLGLLHLAPPFYWTVQKLAAFNVAALMQKVELLDSQTKFKIDNSFGIKISWTVIPFGGSNKRKNVHTKVDRKIFANLIVTVLVGENLCLPAALMFGKFRLAHNVSAEWQHGAKWKDVIKNHAQENYRG